MKNLRPFQIVLLSSSLFTLFAAVAFLAFYKGDVDEGTYRLPTEMVIWGVVDETVFQEALDAARAKDSRIKSVRYIKFSENSFIYEFITAVAEDRSPDLIVLPHEQLVELRAIIYPLSYDFYSLRSYKNSFVEGSEIFTLSNGIYALPFAVDPLVMYWNRDIFSSNNIAEPPTTWEQLRNDTVPTLSKINNNRSLLASAISFGEYGNVRNAKEIMSMLFLQSGDPIVSESTNGYRVNLETVAGEDKTSATTILSFYTQFSDPSSSLYSWNRSLPEDRSHFLSGDLALYFGFGSELTELEDANPNLNFDMALVPQGQSATILRDFGRFYGFAIPTRVQDTNASYVVASVLTSPEIGKILAEGLEMAPVTREVLAQSEPDQYQVIRNQSALISHAWLEPDYDTTEQAFQEMIEDVTSGRLGTGQSLSKARNRLLLGF